MELQLSTLGSRHTDTLMTQTSPADQLGRLGQHQEAADLHANTLETQQEMLGEEHPECLESQASLAIKLAKLGDYQSARQRLQDVSQLWSLEVANDANGDADARRMTLRRLRNQHNLALELSALGSHKKAVEILQHVLLVAFKSIRS